MYLAWEYWAGPGNNDSVRTARITSTRPLVLPATGEPQNSATLAASYYVLSPVLSNGWAYLGEPGKIVSAARRRVASVVERNDNDGGGIEVKLLGSPGEVVKCAFQAPQAAIGVLTAICSFGMHCPGGDCELTAICNSKSGGCKCGDSNNKTHARHRLL